MDDKDLFQYVDHTLLQQTAAWKEIKAICDDGIQYQTASVCIPPSFVKKAKEYIGERLKICTVIGFPNGYNTTAVKVFETEDAIKNGADEIDMVINLGMVKEKDWNGLEAEIKAIKKACQGKVLKVIIETCLLTEEEKKKLCQIVTHAEADFIKTSTGFSTAGATFEDVELFAKNVGEHVKIKAAGGISSMEDGKRFIELGASRLGTSRIVKIAKQENSDQMDTKELIKKAFEARKNSYAPYSNFKVGAALEAKNGTIYTGCNIENAAYTPCNCAERTAFFKAVSEGEHHFQRIAIVGGYEEGDMVSGYAAPCGVCRQVMMEFCVPEEFKIIVAKSQEDYKEFTLAELLPMGFGPDNLAEDN